MASVEDNGSGFNVEEAFDSGGSRTIGLSNIRERIYMLGGALKIESRLGQGTRAEFRIPLQQGAETRI
jgi:signal transduction histidine kinase